MQDNYNDFWVGNLFGKTVRGKGEGAETKIKGCRVIGIEGQTIVVESISDGNEPVW